ncbi:polymer-forming cytoskeletal protein [Aureivirga sp. CE67]|uniref:bactofilin family protein n=1 Tax=Aureivirga sp. CE67 TaxID=1788983 RepID=UPI0018CB2261|nr:polymer-forming cytoskeletal protein [Aureivirga sp. CE67]
MFSDKKVRETSSNPQSLERNTIAKSTSITGDITSDGDFRIDGFVEGNIKTAGRVVIGKEGKVEGTITCSNADIEGTFTGQIKVSQLLSLKSTARLTGETVTGKLFVEPDALVNGSIEMNNGSVKELRNATKEKTA